MKVATPEGEQEVPVLNALNEVMRESYLKDCEIGLKRWNRTIERAGHEFRLSLPSARFRRAIGAWAGQPVDPLGKLLPEEEYSRRLHEWIPSQQDRDYVKSLMRRGGGARQKGTRGGPPPRGATNLPL